MNNFELFDFGKKATIGFHHMNGTYPDEIASGCLINYLNKIFILTVAHAVSTGGWALKLEVTPELQQKYFRPQYTFMKHGLINEDAIQRQLSDLDDLMLFPEEVDFAFAELPNTFEVFDQNLVQENDLIKIYSRPKHIFNTDLQKIPEKGKKYSFFGEIKGKINHEKKQIITVLKLISDIEFLCSDGDFHYFNLPSNINDASDYQGCSGAPIFDENYELVSLVVGGSVGTNRLWGINLSKYKYVLDVENTVLS
jgi:hypothetical protein